MPPQQVRQTKTTNSQVSKLAKTKNPTKHLTRLFDRTTSPIYIVGADQIVTYANQSCADWVGFPLEKLISTRLIYTSQTTGSEIENVVQGLCPPPDLLSISDSHDQNTAGPTFSVSINQPGGQKSWRSATLSSLLDADQNHLGILVVCGEQELPNGPDTDAIGCDNNSSQIHLALSEIRKNTDRIYSLESLVGSSPYSTRLRRQVDTAINSSVDLLITGAQGTGKEHLARTIHATRDRQNHSELLPIHCSIADQQLIQQNIKDIVASRTPKGTTANDSESEPQDWLLLLDVDQLGNAAQHELLGFFQLPNFPLRTIATATTPLLKLADKNAYSIELANFLSTMTIELVPLAERLIDVTFLAQALLERDNFRRDKQLSGFSKTAMQRLTEFEWPENIDQLNRTIQAAASKTIGPQIEESDLPDEFQQALKAMRIGVATETEIDLDKYLGEIESELVARALRQAKGNKTKAAKLLGVSRPKLLRRIQFFGLETQPDFSEDLSGELDSSAFEELD
ncbi:MAG: sigma 54-interacting transcriptional regulator [Mariniblastus sp.]